MLIQYFTITNAGGTDTIDVESLYTDYVVNGTAITLSSSYTIAPSGTPTRPVNFKIWFNADVSLSGNDITIFSNKLTSLQATGGVLIEITYDFTGSGAWVVSILDNSAIHDVEGVEITTLTSAGAVIELDPNLNKRIQKLIGGATLVDSVSITITGTPKEGDYFYIHYLATLTKGGNNVVLEGNSLSASEALLGNILIYAYYDGSGWVTVKLQDPDYVRGQKDTFIAPASFETDGVGTIYIQAPFDFKITLINANVSTTVANTDDGSIVVDINGSTVATLTIPASSAVGTQVVNAPSSSNTGQEGDLIGITSAKTTDGGSCAVQIIIESI